jgi:hypothetical protein
MGHFKIGDMVKIKPLKSIMQDYHNQEGTVTKTKDYNDQNGVFTIVWVKLKETEVLFPADCYELATKGQV